MQQVHNKLTIWKANNWDFELFGLAKLPPWLEMRADYILTENQITQSYICLNKIIYNPA